MWFVLILFLAVPVYSAEATSEDKTNTVAEELQEISDEMYEVQDALREDRSDKSIQITQKDINERLERFVNEIENTEKQYRNGKLTHPTPRQLNMLGLAGAVPRDKPSTARVVVRRTNAVMQESNAWSYLPALARDKILQIWGSDIPLRWKMRISAYYVSVAAQESERIK